MCDGTRTVSRMKKSGINVKMLVATDIKEYFKNVLSFSGQFEQLLRPSSPTPFFTPLKAVQSPLRGSLPMTTPLGMDSLVGDVPTFQAAPAGPLSPSSISYRTLLDNLPSQLHPKQKVCEKTLFLLRSIFIAVIS